MVFDKPVNHADVSLNNGVYDSWRLEEKEWTFRMLDRIGRQLAPDSMDNLKDLTDRCLHDIRFRDGRDQVRAEAWVNIGNSAESIADCLVKINRAF